MPLQILESVASTMDYARENLTSGKVSFNTQRLTSPSGVLAREQTAGRGQRGRYWFAPKDEALCATYYYGRGLTEPAKASEIALIAGVAAAHALQSAIQESGRGASTYIGLKWPNDLIVNGRKVGGILVEMAQTPDHEWAALIGVGINLSVMEFPAELRTVATSLALEGITGIGPIRLGESIEARLHEMADRRRTQGLDAILELWRLYDVTSGRRFSSTHEGKSVTGVAEGIADDARFCFVSKTIV